MRPQKRMYLLALCALIGLSTAARAAEGAGNKGGGAGCVDDHGHLKTLFYCMAYSPSLTGPSVPPQPVNTDAASEVPEELSKLQKRIDEYPYLTREAKDRILKVMKPGFARKYFSTVAPPDLTAPIVARIKEEFHRATGLDPSKLALYAVTDTNAHMSNYDKPVTVTYLLPAYRRLKTDEERMTALFHENLWAMNPDSTYESVIGKELAFEGTLNRPDDTVAQISFVANVGFDFSVDQAHLVGDDLFGIASRSPGLMTLVLKHDLETDALKGFVDGNGEFSSRKLFGSLPECHSGGDDQGRQECLTGYLNEVDRMRRTNPKSLFLAFIKPLIKTMVRISYSGEILPDKSAIVYVLLTLLDGQSDWWTEWRGFPQSSLPTVDDGTGRRRVPAPLNTTNDGGDDRLALGKIIEKSRTQPGITHLLWAASTRDETGHLTPVFCPYGYTEEGKYLCGNTAEVSPTPFTIKLDLEHGAETGPLVAVP